MRALNLIVFAVLAALVGCRHMRCTDDCDPDDVAPCRTPCPKSPPCPCPSPPVCAPAAQVVVDQPPPKVTVRPAEPVQVHLPQQQVVIDPPPMQALAQQQPMMQAMQGMQPVSYQQTLPYGNTRLALSWDTFRLPIPYPRFLALPTTQQVTMQAPMAVAPAQAFYAAPTMMQAPVIQQAALPQAMLAVAPAQAIQAPPQVIQQPVIQPVIQPLIQQQPVPPPTTAPLTAATAPAANSDYCRQLEVLEAAIQASRAAMCPK